MYTYFEILSRGSLWVMRFVGLIEFIGLLEFVELLEFIGSVLVRGYYVTGYRLQVASYRLKDE
jgi:hypothetical protein